MSGADVPAPPAGDEKLSRLVLKMPDATRRKLKGRAAELGISTAVYFVRLARADGVEVPEMVCDGRRRS